MKTKQMSLLRVLSVMVLLLFAAPMMDGVLTLFQSQHLGETTFFEPSVYAGHNDGAPSSDNDETEHTGADQFKACARKVANCIKYAWISVYIATRVVDPSPPPGGTEIVRQWEYSESRSREKIIVSCQCPPPNDNDSTSFNGNDNDSTSFSGNDYDNYNEDDGDSDNG